MYYPYLRGKQFDLLALKEALSRGLLSNKIQPVIEPVRDSATLKNVIELFQKKHHRIAVIQNPQVGQFKLFDQHVHSWTVKENSSVVPAQILTPENLSEVLDSPPAFLVFDGQHYPKDTEVWKQLAGVDSKFLIPDTSRFRIWLPENKIVIRDSFQTRKHVESYADKMTFLVMTIFFSTQTDILDFLISRSKVAVISIKGSLAERLLSI